VLLFIFSASFNNVIKLGLEGWEVMKYLRNLKPACLDRVFAPILFLFSVQRTEFILFCNKDKLKQPL